MADFVVPIVGTILAGAAACPSWVLETNEYLLRDLNLLNRETNILVILTALALSMVGIHIASFVGSIHGR